VLLVDDEADLAQFARLLLEEHGYRVLVVGSGAAALAALAKKSRQIDVVITDMLMSFIDGATLAKSIQKNWPHLPVILASGADPGDFADEWKGLEFCGRLQKPYTRQRLLLTVRQSLDEPRPRQV
jgi:DNA-binding NtrC family response regulator